MTLCGRGCVVTEAAEVCSDQEVEAVVEVPEERCDLQPRRICRLVTKLLPKLTPHSECTDIPKQFCQFKFTVPKIRRDPYENIWC